MFQRPRKKTITLLLLLIATLCLLFYTYDANTNDSDSTSKPLHLATLTRQTRNSQESNQMESPNHLISSEERLANLRAECQGRQASWSRLSVAEKRILARQVIVDDEHKLLFCFIPKAGCANWKRVFRVLDGRDKNVNHIAKFDHKDFKFLEDLPPRAIQRRLDTYFKFVFVREPLSRLLSAYKNKLQNSTAIPGNGFVKRYVNEMTKHRRKHNSEKLSITLSDFFLHISKTKAAKLNDHWMPFKDLCQPCAMNYDFVGSLENIEQDSQKVFRLLNIQDKVVYPTRQHYYDDPETGNRLNDKLLSTVPRKLVQKALRKFERDYVLFSYPYPGLRRRS
ncbi:carbohydrate sulfotransferase 14 isoform X2 [Nematostella vectensis]|uniref:carbohydrate sulfotransferase 14 isoform X2 n=1 Tax=Nematostella vectensis TaxID=45351 RepID=UPI00138FBC93|nr:carbohydrate sulfotransferase 14 isoform X2 [Nematostella vectensis]